MLLQYVINVFSIVFLLLSHILSEGRTLLEVCGGGVLSDTDRHESDFMPTSNPQVFYL